MTKRHIVLFASLFATLCVSLSGLFAQIPDPSVSKILDAAEVSFESGEYGDALAKCESARLAHRKIVERYLTVLNSSLSPREVKHAGDDIAAVRAVLEKRNDTEAVEIIDMVLQRRPATFFSKSMQGLVEWLGRRVVIPEADILSGAIYEAEGEYGMSLKAYREAWKEREFLDIPDRRFEVLYRMADISAIMGDQASREQYLLLVLTEDPLFGKPGVESPSLKAMLRTILDSKDPEKFFSLYRHNNAVALKAYQDLVSFYYGDSDGRLDRALPVAVISAVISISLLEDAITRANFEYVYKGFPDILIAGGSQPEILGWAEANGIWDSFLLLAAVLYDGGSRSQALSIWSDLARYCPDAVTSRKASGELNARK